VPSKVWKTIPFLGVWSSQPHVRITVKPLAAAVSRTSSTMSGELYMR
jgi:hypothetical protein